jgi:hypothetical protein
MLLDAGRGSAVEPFPLSFNVRDRSEMRDPPLPVDIAQSLVTMRVILGLKLD